MLKSAVIFATLCLMSVVNGGLLSTHHVIHEPAVAQVGHIVHSSPSAISHQSVTQVHGERQVVQPIVAPVIKTTIHSVPVVHTPVVHTYHDTPVLHTVPVVHSAPLITVHH